MLHLIARTCDIQFQKSIKLEPSHPTTDPKQNIGRIPRCFNSDRMMGTPYVCMKAVFDYQLVDSRWVRLLSKLKMFITFLSPNLKVNSWGVSVPHAHTNIYVDREVYLAALG